MEERFLKHINKTDGCWKWTGSVSRRYGMFKVNKKVRRANRVAYELWNGSIPDGLHILHSCDNTLCVNPQHLRVGTNTENVADRHERNRWANMKGTNNSNSKLNEDDVEWIRVIVGFYSLTDIARMYNISITTIWAIKNNKLWKV
jgi:hypothetical protein